MYFFGKEADNEDRALMMDIRKKDMINNLKVIMTLVIISLAHEAIVGHTYIQY